MVTGSPLTSEPAADLAERILIALTWVPAPYQEEARERVAALLSRVETLEGALRELASVPEAGPFPNKGACRAFAAWVRSVADEALRAGSPRGEEGATDTALSRAPELAGSSAASSSPDGAPPDETADV